MGGDANERRQPWLITDPAEQAAVDCRADRERAAQGLPPTIRDPEALAALVRLVQSPGGKTKPNEKHKTGIQRRS